MCVTRQGGKFSGMTLDIKFFDQNVRGLRQKIKRTKIFLHAKERGDIIFLQETHSIPDDEEIWKNEWEGDIFFSHGTSASKGAMILVKNHLKYKP